MDACLIVPVLAHFIMMFTLIGFYGHTEMVQVIQGLMRGTQTLRGRRVNFRMLRGLTCFTLDQGT